MYNDNEYAIYSQRMNIYFIGGYVFDLSETTIPVNSEIAINESETHSGNFT